MVYHLRRSKADINTRTTDLLITRLSSFTIRTGTLTSVAAVLCLGFFLALKDTDLEDVPFLALAKLYSNTVLANLNVRDSISSSVLAVQGHDFVCAINGLETEGSRISANDMNVSESLPVYTMARAPKLPTFLGSQAEFTIDDALPWSNRMFNY